MNAARKLALTILLTVGLAANSALAQSTSAPGNGTNSPTASSATATPVVVGKGNTSVPTDLKGLVGKFSSERSAYLAQQAALLAKLEKATTPEERAAIRLKLQNNRDAFLADLKEYRQDLKQQIVQLKNTLNNADLNRIIDEVRAAESGTSGDHHHKKL